MAEPIAITCPGAYTVTITHELSLPPLQLDEAGGVQIAVAILAVWAFGWGFRALIQMLKKTDGETSTESN